MPILEKFAFRAGILIGFVQRDFGFLKRMDRGTGPFWLDMRTKKLTRQVPLIARVRGDHLGSNPRRAEPIDVAKAKTREHVRPYMQAWPQRFTLKAHKACGGETGPATKALLDHSFYVVDYTIESHWAGPCQTH